PVPAGGGGRFIGIENFGFGRHLFPLRAQRVPFVQAAGWIENQNDEKKKNPPKRVKCGCVEDA
ncbi:hypothetical protein, partial [Escherichia coli]|uniref:hypothetical protein n=1 Tax=Escherichia coli TaxID=562 RepID=UPI000B6E8208